MEKYLVKLVGVTPMLMHNGIGADPLNPYVKQMKEIQKKRTNKSDADIEKLAELQFLASLYWSDELGGVYMPTDNITKMILEAARSSDKMKGRSQFINFGCTHWLGYPLDVKNRDNLKKLAADKSLYYTTPVVVSRSRVIATKAIFKQWSCDVEIEVNTDELNLDIVQGWFDYAGRYKGLGCRRPSGPTPGKFGQFIVESFEKVT